MQLLYHAATYAAFKPPVPISKEHIHSNMAQQARVMATHVGYTERLRPERPEETKPLGRHAALYN